MIVTCWLGNDSFYSSHIYITFHSKSFVTHQRKTFIKPTDAKTRPVVPDIADDHEFRAESQDNDNDDDSDHDKNAGETQY